MEKKRKDYTKFSLVWELLKGSKRYFVISIIATLLVNVLDLLSPQIIRTTVDSIIGKERLDVPVWALKLIESVGGVSFLREHLWIVGIVIILLALCSACFRYIYMLYNRKGAEYFVMVMRNRLFSHIQHLPFSWHTKNQTGDIIQRCTSDVELIKSFIADQLSSVFRFVMMIVLALVFMFSMNVKMAWIAAVFIPIIIAYSTYFHSHVAESFRECDESEGVLSAIAQENLTGVRVVRAFGREKYEKDRFEKQNNLYTELWMKLCRLLALFWGTGDLVSGLQIMSIVVFGSYFCVQGEMTAGAFIAFISYNTMLIHPVRSLGRTISEMSKAGVSIERIHYILNSQVEQDKEGAGEADMHGDIEFHNVSFAYGDMPILSNISFKVPQGTTFGILGSTGSGKSTLMYLLNRLYDLPQENGKITVGGVDIADRKASWVRQNVGMVLQEPYLFSRTIAENIGITKEKCTLEEIRHAAAIACVDESVMEFTHGYDTMVGERGVTLSGGQKQRTAIARMLTQKAPIMVFDDSLSAVDAQTDAMIRRALESQLGTSTIFLIAHRVTTLMKADCIMVLDRGKIAEMGSHEELMQKQGIYWKIYQMQMSLGEELEEDAVCGCEAGVKEASAHE